MAGHPTLILAPIRGITDAVYRAAVARCFGEFERAVAPFIQLRQGQALRPGELRQVAPEHNRTLPTIPQVLTHHAPTFAAALRELHEAGHAEVNWNLGCPYPMVAKRGRGAGLLPHPERIDAILAQVLANSPVRLSVKLRLGYRDPDEIGAVLEVLNRYPLAEVILHPRTATQMYGGSVDIARAGQALAACRHPFVYSGDITGVDGFRDLRQRLPGVAAWMLGRGALACPFLPGLLRGEPMPLRFDGSDVGPKSVGTECGDVPVGAGTYVCGPRPRPGPGESAALRGEPMPPPETRRHRLREFHDQLFDGYGQWLSGPRHRLDKMKEQWAYLALAFAASRQVLARICRSDSVDAYEAAVAWAFEQALAPVEGRGSLRVGTEGLGVE